MNKIENLCGTRRLASALAVAGLLIAFCPAATNGDEPLPKGHYKLLGAKIISIDRTEKGDVKSDRLTHQIRFDIEPRYEIVKGTEAQPFKILNPTVGTKSSLTLDKPITFKGEIVPAGTNLLKHKKFDGAFFNVHLPDLFPSAINSAIIRRDFVFPADTYTVKFAWTTEAGAVLSETVKVHIDIHPAGER